ncbi:MAG: hypothetical protein ACOYZ6_12375 [Chloroflexota bacterium]
MTKNRSFLVAAAFVLLILLGVWIFIAVTGIGITPDVAFWNEAGVPLLGQQILFALVIGAGLGVIVSHPLFANHPIAQKRIGKILLVDMVLSLALWGFAAGIWLAEPQQQSFNAPRPSLPTYEYYPYSDSAAYDLGAQYALIGQGINNDLLTDKPFYQFFLMLLHLAGGQSVRLVMGLQVLVLALFPVILYLLGRGVHSRGLGIFVALLAIFKERNAIAAVLDIQVSHAKLMMTELPTALLISVAALLLFQWAAKPSTRSASLPIWIGGVIGAAVLTRANAFAILPLALLVPVWFREQGWRTRIVPALLILLGFALFVSPWLLTNRGPDGRTAIQVKLEQIFDRYQDILPSGFDNANPSPRHASAPQLAALTLPIGSDPASFLPRAGALNGTGEMTALEFVPAHFFHNQIAAIFILPTNWSFQNLAATVNSPLWEKNWSGALTFENGAMLLLNLVLLALGLAAAYRRWRFAGLIPAFVEILYYLANALARTSGSRYLVPADWVVYFYYALGLFQLAEWLLELTLRPSRAPLLETGPASSVREKRWGWLLSASAVLILGMLLPLPSFAVPQRYLTETRTESYKAFRAEISLADLGFDQKDVRNFIRHPDAFVLRGRLLYPRYFAADEGLCKRCYVFDAAFGNRSYPRLTFILLGPTSAGVIVEMPALPEKFRKIDLAAAPDVWVIGCKDHTDYFGVARNFQSAVRGLVIAISSESGLQVYRTPAQRLTCE